MIQNEVTNNMPTAVFRKRKRRLLKEPLGLGIFLIAVFLFTLLVLISKGVFEVSSSQLTVESLTGQLKISIDRGNPKEATNSAFSLNSGERTITLSKESSFYAPYERKINLVAETESRISWELGPSVPFSQGVALTYDVSGSGLSLTSNPEKATVSIDGKEAGTSPYLKADLEVGTHVLLVKKEGYLSREIAVDIVKSKLTRVSVQLMAIPVPEEVTKIREEGLSGKPEVNAMARYDWKCDESLSDHNKTIFQPVNKIILENLSLPDAPFGGETTEWVKGIYYYETAHIGFSDIPYHYLVDSQGKIFSGKSGGCEAFAVKKDQEEKPVAECRVGYLGKAGEEVTALALESFDKLRQNVQGWVSRAEAATPEPVSGDSGSSQSVNIIYKNTGTKVWYLSQNTALRPQEPSSKFYAPGVWKAQDIVSPLSQPWVAVDDMVTIALPILIPAIPGEHNEKFALYQHVDGNWSLIPGSEVSVKVIAKGEVKNMVRIKETGVGFLRVRSGPGSAYDETGRVIPGEVLPYSEERNGWLKITYGNGLEGWVLGSFTEKL